VARTKEFDPDAVLGAAMELFWQRGYEATSTADLVEHLGIGRASLYATFGSKHELYLRALERYVEDGDPPMVEALSQPGPAMPAIRALVRRFAEEAANDELRRGCFVVNAAMELPADAAATQRVRSSWDTLEVALTSALTRAQAQGELAAGRDPRALARFLVVILQGMRVLGKGGSDPSRLRDAAEQALATLDIGTISTGDWT
jgi:TetR/AcrR family transcriptional regulator, transcriptional repressor for nem operon